MGFVCRAVRPCRGGARDLQLVALGCIHAGLTVYSCNRLLADLSLHCSAVLSHIGRQVLKSVPASCECVSRNLSLAQVLHCWSSFRSHGLPQRFVTITYNSHAYTKVFYQVLHRAHWSSVGVVKSGYFIEDCRMKRLQLSTTGCCPGRGIRFSPGFRVGWLL